MQYHNIEEGVFLSRPNRFIAEVEVAGRKETSHVKNTGRCAELLIPGAKVYLERNNNPGRKTALDLIHVVKGRRLINIDSQAPNQAVAEWLKKGSLSNQGAKICPERKYKDSRFDFYIEDGEVQTYIEVKGVTLEEDGIVRFPDAPTLRGLKHVKELIGLAKAGFKAYIMFVIQMEGVDYFTPNKKIHPEFAEMLEQACESGVGILAYDCKVTRNSMELNNPVPIKLREIESK